MFFFLDKKTLRTNLSRFLCHPNCVRTIRSADLENNGSAYVTDRDRDLLNLESIHWHSINVYDTLSYQILLF